MRLGLRYWSALALCAFLAAGCGGGGGGGGGGQGGVAFVPPGTATGTDAPPDAAHVADPIPLPPDDTLLPPVIVPSFCAPEIDKAVQTGDATGFTDPAPLALCARKTARQIADAQRDRAASIYGNASSEYQVGRSSQLVMPISGEAAQPLVVGDKGQVLASLATPAAGRAAGYGTDVLAQFDGGSNLAHAPVFKRLLGWLVQGDADAALPEPLVVGLAGIDTRRAAAGLAKAGVRASSAACDFMATPGCVQGAQLLIVGSGVAPAPDLEARVGAMLAAGKPVLYLHTNGWAVSESGQQMLAGMGLKSDGYSGNYFSEDSVAAGRGASVNQKLLDPFDAVLPLLGKMAANTWRTDYDWSACAGDDCSGVPGLNAELLDPANSLRSQVDTLSGNGRSLFATPNTLVLRLTALWADVVRQQIRYPLDRARQPQAFQQAAVADSLVAYARPAGTAQPDLGSFMGSGSAGLAVSSADEVVELTLPAESGFTAVGRFAVPGKALTAEVLDAGGARIALRLNTQRGGSTRMWTSYDRPRFLASPAMALTVNRPLQVTSPYGGTLQLSYSGAKAGAVVRLRLRGVAQHPFLDLTRSADAQAFVAALNQGAFDWAEIKLAGVEIHTRVDKMKEALKAGGYSSDLVRYISELRTLFFEDAYALAGFRLAGKSLPAAVQAFCTGQQWDCTSDAWHKGPGVQHINADAYAACGAGCSGNPYDQSWGVGPRGWGESHELGHNLQKGMLNVYAGRSGEVSNNMFPLHKKWRIYRELGGNDEDARVNYRSAFDMIKAASTESDKVDGAYQRIWGSDAYAVQNGERMAFYVQWVHYWEERTGDPARGWELFTLLYLHQRQFEKSDWATYKNRLGYSTYADRPSVDGNDNLLITLSFITQRDQRAMFDLWGVRYTAAAAAQVDSYGFAKETPRFYANRVTNDHGTVVRIDMSSPNPVWPF